ncbi:HAD-IA family hydrolase, partial [candidate division GN15 bacterium]|nr:HAD-IA family hydrolase [candidate division GN15 bacterium]
MEQAGLSNEELSELPKLQPRVVIFDLGSTLIEYESIPWDDLGVECAESGWRFLSDEGFDIPDKDDFHLSYCEIRDQYRKIARESHVEWDVPMVATKLFHKLGIRHDEKLVDKFFDAYYEPVDVKLFAYDDTLITLERIRKKYDKIGLISNTVFPERAHLAELKRFEIEPYMDFTIFSSTFGLRKPHPDIFRHAVNLAGVAPSEAVYIGDRYMEDVQGPTAIGMDAILKLKEDREYPEDMPEAKRRIVM